MLREEPVEAGREVILTQRLPSLSTLAPLSVRFPDFSVAGFLTTPTPPPHLDKWSVYTHLYESPGALDQGLAGPQRGMDLV